jgi:adenylate kinase
MMDWGSGEGEENEGMVGNYINFGAIGKEHVVDAHEGPNGEKIEQDDVFILIAPQSMVGIESSIMGPLSEMVEAAGDRPVILLNPDLTDKVGDAELVPSVVCTAGVPHQIFLSTD